MVALAFFILVSLIVSWIDGRYSIIPDKLILPSIAIMGLLMAIEGTLDVNHLVAVVVILIVFIIPIALNLPFGGGDLRFGAFCALFLGLEPLGYFIALAGIVHLIIMGLLHKNEFGFAPAMSIASLAVYGAVHA